MQRIFYLVKKNNYLQIDMKVTTTTTTKTTSTHRINYQQLTKTTSG